MALAAATNQVAVTVIEEYAAAPPPCTVSDLSIPLTFCDMVWIGSTSTIQRLLFYKSSISESYFIDSLLPKLKHSLNLTLQHFPSLAGNMIIPSDLSPPEIRYINGDSVSLIFAKSNTDDFDYLTSNQSRNCGLFYPFVPLVPKSSKSPNGLVKVPLLALQVTLIPEIGICIGISNNHIGADGSSMYAFTKAWTKLSRLGEDGTSLGDEDLPYYNRDVMSHTKKIDDIMWSSRKNKVTVLDQPQILDADTDKVRATFVFGLEDVKKLKNYVLSQRSSLKQISTFVVTSAYIWTCLTKVENFFNDKVEEDRVEYFIFLVNPRGRDDPHIPKNYFGNCFVFCPSSGKNKELVADNGFPIAAEQTQESINDLLRNKEQGPFDGLAKLFLEFSKIELGRALSVSGSPKQNYYEMDFGWGKPTKIEFISIDSTGSLSVSADRDSSGVLEFGLELPKEKMDAFTTFFIEGLQVL